MSFLRRWLGRLGLLLAGLVIALLLAELGLRLRSSASGAEFLLAMTPELYDTSIFTNDPDSVVALVPGSSAHMRTVEYDQLVEVNELGMRGGPPPAEDAPGLRILTVGDSFTLGMQVAEEQLFTSRLGVGLADRLAAPVLVFNGGVDSHGTPHATANAARLVPRVHPDELLLVFFTGNDFNDNSEYRQARNRRTRFGPRPEDASRWITRRSFLAMYAKVWLKVWMPSGQKDFERYRRELSIFNDPRTLEEQVKRSGRYLKALRDRCRDWEVRCRVAIAPPAFVVYPDRQESTFKLFGMDTASLDVDGPARALAEAMPRGLEALDLAPALREAAAAGEGPLYFTLDGHWTAKGHAVVAKALTDWMEEGAREDLEAAPAPTP